ncbi:MAG: transposase [Clostridia bacterium]|nr:transposase [Clostridia bacterium]
MTENLPIRKPTRLKDYDYSSAGAYFITICTHNRKNILSKIVGEGSPLPQLTTNGKLAEEYVLKINEKYPCVKIDKYVIMPNHMHLILRIDNDGRGNPSPTVSNVVGWLKYSITKQINRNHDTAGNIIFQRSFHDHVIRDYDDYLKIWEYISTNPAKWQDDCFYTE